VKVNFCDCEPCAGEIGQPEPSADENICNGVLAYHPHHPIQLASKIVAFCCVFQLSEQDFVRTDFGLKFYILQTPPACTSFDNCTHAANLTSNAVLWG